jgi:hypothetical protein
MSEPPPEHLRARIRAEYLEMPGLQLTLEQAQRLCGMERPVCQRILDSLVDEKFLYLSATAHYARLTDGEMARPRTVKANLRLERPVLKAS